MSKTLWMSVSQVAEDRDVLAPGVDDDLDFRVGEDLGAAGRLEAVERVEDLDPHAAVAVVDVTCTRHRSAR